MEGEPRMRELMAKNVIAVWLDLECTSGNDARATESESREGPRSCPFSSPAPTS